MKTTVRKGLALLLAAVLLAATAFTAGAEGETTVTADTSEVGELAPGDTFDVPVVIAGNPGFVSYTLTPVFDADSIEYVSFAEGDVGSGDHFVNESTGVANYSAADDGADDTGDGTLLIYTFRVKSGVTGEVEIGLSSDDFCNAALDDVVAEYISGVVYVGVTPPQTYAVSFVSGDANDTAHAAPTVGNKAEGATFKLPKNPFAYDGHAFAGWSDGTDTYTAGAEYVMPGAAVTFTALWTEEGDAPTAVTYTLIQAAIENAAGNIPTFRGEAMYRLAGDDAYYYYIVKTGEYEAGAVGFGSGTAEVVARTGDANGSGRVDVNDAQFIYNLYNADMTVPYAPTVKQLLAADVNGDGRIDSADCTAAVAAIG